MIPTLEDPLTYKTPQAGFSLAEVLIALLILGVIAGLTLPKIFRSTNDESVRSKLIEAVAVLE